MRTRALWITAGVVTVMGPWGCTQPNQRLNAPPQGHCRAPSKLQNNFTPMVDNSMLEDLCVADIHFVSHTSAINSLGARRLNRYGELLETYGGTIHLNTASRDDALIAQRLGNVREYLADTGLDMGKVQVEVGMPRGRATDANEAIRIREEGTTNDSEASGSAGAS